MDVLSTPIRYLINKIHERGLRIASNDYISDFKWAYGVVVSMFDFHRSDRGSNPGRGGKIS